MTEDRESLCGELNEKVCEILKNNTYKRIEKSKENANKYAEDSGYIDLRQLNYKDVTRIMRGYREDSEKLIGNLIDIDKENIVSKVNFTKAKERKQVCFHFR